MTNPKKNPTRKIVKHIRGKAHGPITRLMSPSDLGETLKPGEQRIAELGQKLKEEGDRRTSSCSCLKYHLLFAYHA